MKGRGHILVGALVCALLLGAGIFGRNLFEQSEGRYGSIAAAMVRSGDWLVPHLNGIAHFEKPPLSMWAMAASMRLFGETEGAARIPGVLASLLAIAAAWRMAGGRDDPRAPWAVAFALASVLFFGMAKVVTTDIYLAACSALSLAFAVRSVESSDPRESSRALDRAALAAGFGFLVKGPVIWILTLLPAIVEALWSKRPSGVRRLFAPRRILLFSVVALPWFLAVAAREPGLLRWFVEKRTVAVLASSKGFHSGPFYFYVPVFFVGVLPAAPVLLLAGREGWRQLASSPRGRLLVLAVVLPLVVFSLSASKLATYALPVVVPTAVLAADALEFGLARRGLRASAVGLVILLSAGLAGGVFSGWFREVGPPATGWLVASSSVLLAAAIWFLWTGRRTDGERRGPRVGVLLGAQVTMFLLALPAAPLAEAHLTRVGVGKDLALALAEAGRDGRPLVSYHCFLQGLPFYTGRRALTLGWYDRDQLSEEDWGRVALADLEALDALARRRPVAVLCKTKNLKVLMQAVDSLVPVREVGRFTILRSAREEPGQAGRGAMTR